MRKIRVIPLLMLGLCLSFAGCKKERALPSQEYFKAKTLWIDLLREKRGKAYMAPETEQVTELLRAVDPKSLDYTSAQTLLEEIAKGRAEARAAEAALQEELERAKRAGQADPSQLVFQPLSTDAGTEPVAAAVDAGAPKEPVAGMAMADFTRLFDRCFEFKNDAVVGGVTSGQVWGLKDLLGCRQEFPRFVSNSVLISEGKVGAIRSNAELTPVKYKMVDGKLVPVTGEDEKAAPAPAPAPAPRATDDEAARNSANLTDSTPKASQNLTDVTPKANQNLNDVTPRK